MSSTAVWNTSRITPQGMSYAGGSGSINVQPVGWTRRSAPNEAVLCWARRYRSFAQPTDGVSWV